MSWKVWIWVLHLFVNGDGYQPQTPPGIKILELAPGGFCRLLSQQLHHRQHLPGLPLAPHQVPERDGEDDLLQGGDIPQRRGQVRHPSSPLISFQHGIAEVIINSGTLLRFLSFLYSGSTLRSCPLVQSGSSASSSSWWPSYLTSSTKSSGISEKPSTTTSPSQMSGSESLQGRQTSYCST